MPAFSRVLLSSLRPSIRRSSGSRSLALAAVLAAAVAPGLAGAQEAKLQIAVLPQGVTYPSAMGISADGSSMGVRGGLDDQYYIWNFANGFYQMTGALNTTYHFDGFSPDGRTMFGRFGNYPAVWNVTGGMSGLTLPPLMILDELTAASADGISYAGTVLMGSNYYAARWDGNGGFEVLDPNGATETRANGISGNGATIVGRRKTGPTSYQACRWDGSTTPQSLPLPAGIVTSFSDAREISTDGSVILGRYYSDNMFHAGLWSPTGWQEIPSPSRTAELFAEHLSGDGKVVSGRLLGSLEKTFLWDALRGTRYGTTALLDAGLGAQLQGWEIEKISGVAHLPDGSTVIAGVLRSLTSTSGETTVFTATIPDAGTFDPIDNFVDPNLETVAGGLSADGKTVVGFGHVVGSQNEIQRQAFVWRKATGRFDIGAGAAAALGVSGDGGTIVGAGQNGGFRWGAAGGRYLGPDALAEGVSIDGAVTVGSSKGSDGIRHTYRWNGARTERYTTYVAGHVAPSHAVGVSADGATFVGSTEAHASGGTSYNTRAFRWTSSGGQMALGDLPGGRVESEALAISADGMTIVGWSHSKNGPEAFVWRDGTMKGLGDLPGSGFASRALAISADGELVGGSGVSGGRNRAVLWTRDGRIHDLNELLRSVGTPGLADWTLTAVTGVVRDGDGRIYVSGNAIDGHGRKQAFHATLPHLPAPTIRP